MFNPGDGIILLGDSTSHGGTVVTGQASYLVNGTPVAVVGDMVACPVKGHGVCPIVEGHPTFTVNGKSVAFHGCHTACGAMLMSSMNNVHALGDNRQPSAQPYYETAVPRTQQRHAAGIRHYLVDTDPAETPCDHPDQALDLAAYIVDEIKRNARSEHAQDMRQWNSVSAEEEATKWRERTNDPSLTQREREALLQARPDFRRIEAVARESAVLKWTSLVRPHGAWDHKPKIAGEKEEGSSTLRFATLGYSSYRWHHKYREYEYYYDIWSNIHYGYIGIYCGFSADDHLDGAGFAQAFTDFANPRKEIADRSDVNGPGFRRYDDSTDNISIRVGFDLYEKYPTPASLTAEIIMQKVVSAPYPIQLESKMRHDCNLANNRKF